MSDNNSIDQENTNSIDPNNYEYDQKLLEEQFKKLAEEKQLLENRRIALDQKEAEALANFPSRFEAELKPIRDALEAKQKENLAKLSELTKKETNLIERENIIAQKENDFNQIQQNERQKAEQEIIAKKAEVNNKLNDYYQNKINELNEQIRKQQEERQAQLEKQIQDDYNLKFKSLEDQLSEKENELKRNIDDLQKKAIDLAKKEQNLDLERIKCKQAEDFYNQEQAKIEDRVKQLCLDHDQSINLDNQRLKDENQRLREQLKQSSEENDRYADLQQKLGGNNPYDVLNKLQNKETELQKLRENLQNIHNADKDQIISQLQATIDNQKVEIDDLTKRNQLLESRRGNATLEAEINQLKNECDIYRRQNETTNNHCKILESKIERLSAAYGNVKDREERIKDITIPCHPDITNIPLYTKDDMSKYEIPMLDNMITNSNKFGLSFPKRLVYAFHTCLKTSEWSPLTVLAGVSGTGKSELPRWYSVFMGMDFLPVSVQPNWDSQEAMLGYFNSIDNKFDAQPMLRFLAQCATSPNPESYPAGLRDSMNTVLLDEMNLAHVELYFAEFLSKLETRRGKAESELPAIDVKLGSGITPYQLELTRNVLWIGTMNQDETTKSLSDKVLDRGNVIFFPRPKVLARRQKLKKIPPLKFLLSQQAWNQWCVTDLRLDDATIQPYKTIVEKINDCLATVGRAIGHRVWQSIEYYMNNYPTIIAALNNGDEVDKVALNSQLKIAFEDALVQKVMPKLRGIETSGESRTKCLDQIKSILSQGVNQKPLAIIEDFNLACNNPFGQFIWNSANYILDSENQNTKDKSKSNN